MAFPAAAQIAAEEIDFGAEIVADDAASGLHEAFVVVVAEAAVVVVDDAAAAAVAADELARAKIGQHHCGRLFIK